MVFHTLPLFTRSGRIGKVQYMLWQTGNISISSHTARLTLASHISLLLAQEAINNSIFIELQSYHMLVASSRYKLVSRLGYCYG